MPRKNTQQNQRPKMRVGASHRGRGGRKPPVPRVRARNPNELVQRSMPLYPDRYRATLRYADSFTLTVTSGAVASYIFSANGLYDPNITGTGHQPAGFDQMMLSYDHYTVVHSRIYAYFHNVTASVAPTASICVASNNTPTTVAQQLMEDGLNVTQRLNYSATEGSLRAMEISTSVARFGGVKQILDDSDYRGTVATNPPEQQYFHVQAWDTENGSCAVGVDVTIEYTAWFTEPRKLTQSLVKAIHRMMSQEQKK